MLLRKGLHHISFNIDFNMFEMLGNGFFVNLLYGHLTVILKMNCFINLGIRTSIAVWVTISNHANYVKILQTHLLGRTAELIHVYFYLFYTHLVLAMCTAKSKTLFEYPHSLSYQDTNLWKFLFKPIPALESTTEDLNQ